MASDASAGWLDAAVAFVRSLGISCRYEDHVDDGFLQGVRIEAGGLVVTPATSVSDILHEAGHLAVLPEDIRGLASGDTDGITAARYEAVAHGASVEWLDSDYMRALINAGEQEATAWAFAAGRAVGIPDAEVIRDEDYSGQGAEVRLALSIRAHPGVHGLRAGGMLCRVSNFPKLEHWLQPAIGPSL